jgi:hypothetical protein
MGAVSHVVSWRILIVTFADIFDLAGAVTDRQGAAPPPPSRDGLPIATDAFDEILRELAAAMEQTESGQSGPAWANGHAGYRRTRIFEVLETLIETGQDPARAELDEQTPHALPFLATPSPISTFDIHPSADQAGERSDAGTPGAEAARSGESVAEAGSPRAAEDGGPAAPGLDWWVDIARELENVGAPAAQLGRHPVALAVHERVAHVAEAKPLSPNSSGSTSEFPAAGIDGSSELQAAELEATLEQLFRADGGSGKPQAAGAAVPQSEQTATPPSIETPPNADRDVPARIPPVSTKAGGQAEAAAPPPASPSPYSVSEAVQKTEAPAEGDGASKETPGTPPANVPRANSPVPAEASHPNTPPVTPDASGALELSPRLHSEPVAPTDNIAAPEHTARPQSEKAETSPASSPAAALRTDPAHVPVAVERTDSSGPPVSESHTAVTPSSQEPSQSGDPVRSESGQVASHTPPVAYPVTRQMPAVHMAVDSSVYTAKRPAFVIGRQEKAVTEPSTGSTTWWPGTLSPHASAVSGRSPGEVLAERIPPASPHGSGLPAIDHRQLDGLAQSRLAARQWLELALNQAEATDSAAEAVALPANDSSSPSAPSADAATQATSTETAKALADQRLLDVRIGRFEPSLGASSQTGDGATGRDHGSSGSPRERMHGPHVLLFATAGQFGLPAESMSPSAHGLPLAHGPSDVHQPRATGWDTEPANTVGAVRLRWQDGIGEARLRLGPDHLGEVSVSVRVDQQAVTATLRASTVEQQQWIAAHEAELRHALGEQGLELDRLVVAVDPDREQRQAPREKPPPPRPRRSRGDDSGQTFEVNA